MDEKGLYKGKATRVAAVSGMILSFFMVLLSPGVSSPLYAEVKEFTLTVTEGTLDIKGTPVPVWLYNGVFPGPEIRVKEGDTVRIKLRNLSGAKHGMFFHGLRVDNRMALQEQVPVDPDYEYAYEFKAEPSGTQLYHCSQNMAEHLSRGMFGAFIVEAKDEPRPDREFVFLMTDWPGGAASSHSGHEAGHPADIMDRGITTINERVVTGDDPQVIEAGLGETVRLRIANLGYLSHRLSLPEGINLTHEDGYPVSTPDAQNEVVVFPGKRYDFAVKAGAPGRLKILHSIEKPRPMHSDAGHAESDDSRKDGHAGHERGSTPDAGEVAIVLDVKAVAALEM
jgi:FtsP/CotA-like multicopper oxidase with cupredoxin domain